MAATRVALLVRHYGARQMLALRRALDRSGLDETAFAVSVRAATGVLV